jgi:hypothetical protein
MLPSKLSVPNDVNVPIHDGIVPASTFILKSIRINIVALQMVLGIVPITALVLISNSFNVGSDPYDEGIVPETIVLLEKLTFTNCCSAINSLGKIPTRLLSSRKVPKQKDAIVLINSNSRRKIRTIVKHCKDLQSDVPRTIPVIFPFVEQVMLYHSQTFALLKCRS